MEPWQRLTFTKNFISLVMQLSESLTWKAVFTKYFSSESNFFFFIHCAYTLSCLWNQWRKQSLTNSMDSTLNRKSYLSTSSSLFMKIIMWQTKKILFTPTQFHQMGMIENIWTRKEENFPPSQNANPPYTYILRNITDHIGNR